MTQLAADCPNCGAPIRFQWSAAVQTTCSYCRSVLVRHDVALERVGEVADLPLTPSPIQLGTMGRYRGRGFTAIGRIVYGWERGSWNEWHLLMDDGSSRWLADAQLDFAISALARTTASLPDARRVKPGQSFEWEGTSYRITTITRARYRGVEGELPFEYWDKDEIALVDFVSAEGRFGTVDWSETPALLFLGEFVDFDALELSNIRQFEGW